ncbi:MAG TPA: 30S ribosomal protein S17 [Terriglobales bacterium]|jgi:small subunit ribosomal protein S17
MTAPETPANLRDSRRNEKVGHVVSTKMAKTVVVEVTLRTAHPLYRRGMTHHRRFYAHDEQGACQVGDVVRIQETRPLSRLKRWRLLEIVRRAAAAPSAAEIAAALGQGELARDTRKPKPKAAPAAPASEETR